MKKRGWSAGPNGTLLWGEYGAAGLFLLDFLLDDVPRLLLQHRAPWTVMGGTWGIPGGAIEPGETAIDAALREAREEANVDLSMVDVFSSLVTAGPYPVDPMSPELPGGWTYTTVIATTNVPRSEMTLQKNDESLALRWVLLSEVPTMDLLPSFAEAFTDVCRAAQPLLEPWMKYPPKPEPK